MPKTKDEFVTVRTPTTVNVIRKNSKYGKIYEEEKTKSSQNLMKDFDDTKDESMRKARKSVSRSSGAHSAGVHAKYKAQKARRDNHEDNDYGK